MAGHQERGPHTALRGGATNPPLGMGGAARGVGPAAIFFVLGGPLYPAGGWLPARWSLTAGSCPSLPVGRGAPRGRREGGWRLGRARRRVGPFSLCGGGARPSALPLHQAAGPGTLVPGQLSFLVKAACRLPRHLAVGGAAAGGPGAAGVEIPAASNGSVSALGGGFPHPRERRVRDGGRERFALLPSSPQGSGGAEVSLPPLTPGVSPGRVRKRTRGRPNIGVQVGNRGVLVGIPGDFCPASPTLPPPIVLTGRGCA